MSDALSELEDEDFYELGEGRVRRVTIKWLDAEGKEKELVDAKVLESGDRFLKFAKIPAKFVWLVPKDRIVEIVYDTGKTVLR